MYCGSNQLNAKVIDGSKVIGTRHGCLRKGIGVGLHMPYDASYNLPYQSIDQRRIYCGDGQLPPTYDLYGSLQQCFSKGVGVGRHKVAQKGYSLLTVIKKWMPYTFVFIIVNASFILTMIYTKPNFILNEKEIDWKILSPYIALVAVLSFTILYRFAIN